VTICLTVFELFAVSDETEVGVVVGVSEEGVVAACFAFSSISSLSDPSEGVEQASEEGEEDEDSGHDDDAFVPWDLSPPGCTEGAARATLSPAS